MDQDRFDDALARLSGHIGETLSASGPLDTVWGRYPYYHEVSADANHHYALGVGDLNPRWHADPEATGAAAPRRPAIPSIVFGLGPGGLSGSVFSALPLGSDTWETWGGAEVSWQRDLLVGDRIVATCVLEDVQPVSGRQGRMLKLTARTEFSAGTDVVAVARTWVFLRFERPTVTSLSTRSLRRWTPDELRSVQEAKTRQGRRGARSWSGGAPKVGDSATLFKGPLTSSMILSFVGGWQGQILGNGDADLGMLDAWPANELGVPQEPHVAGHYSEWHAKQMGLPGIYDCGPQRVSWAIQLLTDWAGDFATVKRVLVEVRGFNFVGDLQRLECSVSRSNPGAPGKLSVDLDLDVRNQDNVQTARGEATVELDLD